MDLLRAQRLYERIRLAKHILFVTDIRIDGDTLGSALGLYHVLHSEGIRTSLFSPSPIPSSYTFLPRIETISTNRAMLNDPSIDLLISFDASNGDHVLSVRDEIPSKPFLISFDHHKTNALYGDLNIVESNVSSTAEVVYRFLKSIHLRPNRESATCLLTGICTDTSIFSNLATSPESLLCASELSQIGARIQDVVKHLFENKSIGQLKLWGRALERLTRHPNHRFITTYILQQDLSDLDCTEDDLEGVTNFLIALLTDDTVMVFRERADGSIKAGMRTITGDVARIASWFAGGGGHKKASGFSIPHVRLRPCQGGVEVV